VLWLCESVLDLGKGILNVSSFLVSLFIKVASYISLLFLDLSNQSLSQTLSNNVDEALRIKCFDILADNSIPHLQTIEPCFSDIKVGQLRLKISVKVKLSKLVDLTASLYFLDFGHLRFEILIDLLGNHIFRGTATERVSYNIFELSTTIRYESLNKLIKVRMADDSDNLIGYVFHLIK